MMNYPHYGHGFGLVGAGGILIVLIWVLIIIGVVVLIRWLVDHEKMDHGAKKSEHRALDILKERYAKGEINKEEFEQKKKDLSA
jgi:putative membrane protein